MQCLYPNGMKLTREQKETINNTWERAKERLMRLAEAIGNVFKSIVDRIDWTMFRVMVNRKYKTERQHKKHQRKLERLLVSQVLDRSPMRKVNRSYC